MNIHIFFFYFLGVYYLQVLEEYLLHASATYLFPLSVMNSTLHSKLHSLNSKDNQVPKAMKQCFNILYSLIEIAIF